MFSKVTIHNFRGFEELVVDDLTRVNLIVGDNGTGKTSLLEALFLLAGAGDPELALRMNWWRGLMVFNDNTRSVFDNLFNRFRSEQSADVSGTRTRAREGQSLQMHIVEAPESTIPMKSVDAEGALFSESEPTSARSREALLMNWTSGSQKVTSTANIVRTSHAAPGYDLRVHRSATPQAPPVEFLHARRRGDRGKDNALFTQVVQDGGKPDMITFLQRLDERVADLQLLSEKGETALHADIGLARMVPLGILGDGAVRVVSIYLGAKAAAGGLLLVDEIDAGIHYSAWAEGFWSGVLEVARQFGVQVFATTHSYECMAAAYDSFKGEDAEEFSMHRLERVEGKLQCKSFGHEVLGTALELGFEVR